MMATGTDLSVHTAGHLAAVAAELNECLRKTLDWGRHQPSGSTRYSHQRRRDIASEIQMPHGEGFRDTCNMSERDRFAMRDFYDDYGDREGPRWSKTCEAVSALRCIAGFWQRS